MKKLLSVLLAALLVVACFSMVGCGVKGKYELESITLAGKTYGLEDKVDMFGGMTVKEVVAEEGFTGFELAKDGKVLNIDGTDTGMTWEKVDDAISFKVAGEEAYKATKDGKNLIIDLGAEMGGIEFKLTFKKA